MIAYVETNFLIDFGLRQENFSATGAIVQLAEASKVVLAVPQISLLEAIHTVEGWRKKRDQLAADLQNEHSRLRRSAPGEPRLETWERTAGELAKLSGEQLKAIQDAMKQVLSRARLLALDLEVLSSAMTAQKSLGLDPADSIIYASVLMDMEKTPETARCFIGRDARFLETVKPEFESRNCRCFQDFRKGLNYLQKPAERA